MSNIVQVNKLWSEKKHLCKLNVAQRLLDATLVPQQFLQQPSPCCLCALSEPGPHNTPVNINSSLSWLHTFTWCIICHSSRALSFHYTVLCETICTLISHPLTFYIFSLRSWRISSWRTGVVPRNFLTVSSKVYSLTGTYLFKGVRCILAVLKVQTLFKKEISAPFLWQQSWKICHLIQPYTYV